MTNVEDIENAIAKLSPEELERFAAWFAEYRASRGGSSEPTNAPELAAGPVAAMDPPTAIAQDNVAVEPGAEPAPSGAGPRYPHVTVQLKDLGTAAGPIVRRVSYALSDAGIGDDEIERYKEQVRASANPIAVTKRWVVVR